MSFFYWKELNTTSYILLTCIGIFFAIGLYFQIVALTKARASIIQPFHYTLIFWAIIWGYLIYDDLPDLPTVIGAIIITISGIYVINQKTTE